MQAASDINKAIQLQFGESTASKDAKRELFEEIAYEEYQRRGAAGGFTKEEFCSRSAEAPDAYHFDQLNRAWWGFQAGFIAASLAGAAQVPAAEQSRIITP